MPLHGHSNTVCRIRGCDASETGKNETIFSPYWISVSLALVLMGPILIISQGRDGCKLEAALRACSVPCSRKLFILSAL